MDEIHRLSRAVEEILYPAMEDYRLDIVIGEGPMARTIKLDLASLHSDRRDDAAGASLPAAPRPLRDLRFAWISTTSKP